MHKTADVTMPGKVHSDSTRIPSDCSSVAVANAEQIAKSQLSVKGHLNSVLHVRPYNPHGLKPIPSRVLEEDDYVNILQLIIERDFFPDLIRLRLQKELFEKERKGDASSAKGISERLEAVRLERLAQRSGRTHLGRRGPHQRIKLLDGREFELDVSQLTLREFQSLFTSEDNSSFEKIVQDEKAKLSKEQSWIEDSAISHNVLNNDTRAAIERGERPSRLLYANTDSRNPFMFPITDGNVGVMELRKLQGSGGNSDETVALCVGTYAHQVPTVAGGSIVHSNTRLEVGDDEDSLGTSMLEAMTEEQQKKIGRAEQHVKNEALFEAMISRGQYSATAVEHQLQLGRLNRKTKGRAYRLQDVKEGLQTPCLTPSHNGYQFMHTPAIEPGVDGTPLMTWGKIGATPLLICGGGPEESAGVGSSRKDDSEFRFQIPEPSIKEVTAQRLTEKVSKKLRSQKARQSTGLREVLKSGTPLFVPGVGTGASQLFGTPRLTGMQLFRRHSSLKRTPLIDDGGTAFRTKDEQTGTPVIGTSQDHRHTVKIEHPPSQTLYEEKSRPTDSAEHPPSQSRRSYHQMSTPFDSAIHSQRSKNSLSLDSKSKRLKKSITDDLLEF